MSNSTGTRPNDEFDLISSKNLSFMLSKWNSTLWNPLGPPEFRNPCELAIQNCLESLGLDLETDGQSCKCKVPPIIVNLLNYSNESSFHPITFLHLINSVSAICSTGDEEASSASSRTQSLHLRLLLSKFWLGYNNSNEEENGNYLVPILLSLSASKSTPDKVINARNYFNQIFHMIEFILQNPKGCSTNEIPVIQLILQKIDTLLRALTDKYLLSKIQGLDSTSVTEFIDTGPLATFIARLLIRYASPIKDKDHQVTTQLITIFSFIINSPTAQNSYLAQRLVSRILIQLPKNVQQKLFEAWFANPANEKLDFGNPKYQLFYPPSAFLNLNELLVKTIPLTTCSTSITFWTNWAQFLISDYQSRPLILKIWSQYSSNYFEFIFNSSTEQLLSSTWAFVALARCLKLQIQNWANLDRSKFQVHQFMSHITQLMDATDAIRHDISLVLATVIWDLDLKLQKTDAEVPKLEFDPNSTNSTGIYAQLKEYYETGVVVNTQPEANSKVVDVSSGKGEDEKFVDKNLPPVPDEQIARLRSANLIPTSFQNVYDVFVGQLKGKDDQETEVLNNLTILRIPILLRNGLRPDGPVVTEKIIRILFQKADDEEDEDSSSPVFHSPVSQIARQALLELGLLAPDSLAKVFRDTIFNERNHSIGDKIRIVRLVQRLLTSNTTSWTLDLKSKNWLTQMEPKFLELNNHNSRIGFLDAPLPAVAIKSNLKDANANSHPVVSNARLESKTRRWGKTAAAHNQNQQNQIINTNTQTLQMPDKTLASALWSQSVKGLSRNFTKDSEKPLPVSDGPTQLLLLTNLQFLNSLVPHVNFNGVEREAIHIVQIFSPYSQPPPVRFATWKILHDLLAHQSVHLGIPTAQYLSDNPAIQAELFHSLEFERNSEIAHLIKTTKRLINYFLVK